MTALFFGVALLKFISYTNTSTTLCESCFCDRQNSSTIFTTDLAIKENACAVILDEESSLLENQFVHCLEGISIGE